MTEQEIAEAEAAVEAAELKLDTAEQYHHRSGGEKAVAELKAARFDCYGARDRVRRLRSQWAAERASEARRAVAEAGFPAKRREALTRDLADARDEAAHAIAALDGAAREALELTAAYAALVQETAAELVAAGLRAGEGGEDGGSTAGTVHLGGETWRSADPGSLLAAVLQAVVASRDARHPLAQLRWQLGGLAEKAARDALLERAAGR